MHTYGSVTVSPVVTWLPAGDIDPAWRHAVLSVSGAAPGQWTVRNNAPGWYLHIQHNGHHIGMADWNAWGDVARKIARESGPYRVDISNAPPATGLTHTEACLTAYRADRDGHHVRIIGPDGAPVRMPHRTVTTN